VLRKLGEAGMSLYKSLGLTHRASKQDCSGLGQKVSGPHLGSQVGVVSMRFQQPWRRGQPSRNDGALDWQLEAGVRTTLDGANPAGR
jgi:hypothetical protein